MAARLQRQVLAVAVLLATTSVVNGWFRLDAAELTTERLDPLVFPGKIGAHTHAVIGGSNFGPNVTTDHLVKSACTTIPIQEDKSNYWAPLLYFQWKNGSFTAVQFHGVAMYYLFPSPGDYFPSPVAFPKDFRMVTGNPTLRENQGGLQAESIQYICTRYGPNDKATPYLPVNCPANVRFDTHFRTCWDGKNLDSPDHTSHVAWSVGGLDAAHCPPTHPIKLPKIFVEWFHGTGAFENVRHLAMRPEQPFVFANGDHTGYGGHADFYNGWEPGALERLIDRSGKTGPGCHQCDRDAAPEKYHFANADCCDRKLGLINFKLDQKCKLSRQVNEVVLGTLDRLPGNNVVSPARVNPAAPQWVPALHEAVIHRDYNHHFNQLSVPMGREVRPGYWSNEPPQGGSTAPTPPAAPTTTITPSSSPAPPPTQSTTHGDSSSVPVTTTSATATPSPSPAPVPGQAPILPPLGLPRVPGAAHGTCKKKTVRRAMSAHRRQHFGRQGHHGDSF